MLDTYLTTPIGILKIIGTNTHVENIIFYKDPPGNLKDLYQRNVFPYPILEQINEYFSGERYSFDLTISTTGSPFQKEVWSTLKSIPYGKTASYTDIASKIGRLEAVRSVATAIGKNPLPIVIPCHRVVGKNGTLNGYSGGLEIKQFLLNHEKHRSERC
ncbi:MAG: methylated-DNA--[protein]-cysteine S-methyltransferase [Candidatus Latescibacterota bacterium]|nr:methylated-DNA--[protein]-cysteine S-methyltransferase [Candidatus Latescibacterota bacterium]